MPILSNPSFGPRVALTYVTIGALMDVWTTVWYFSFRNSEVPTSPMHTFWLLGFFLTGLTLIVLGVALGPLGQQARKAELPPSEAAQAEAEIQQTAAAHPPAVAVPMDPNGTATPHFPAAATVTPPQMPAAQPQMPIVQR